MNNNNNNNWRGGGRGRGFPHQNRRPWRWGQRGAGLRGRGRGLSNDGDNNNINNILENIRQITTTPPSFHPLPPHKLPGFPNNNVVKFPTAAATASTSSAIAISTAEPVIHDGKI
jgi:hypothetical protein